jgi:hypothetical protein
MEIGIDRRKLWEARDELDDLIYECYCLSRNLSAVGLMPPSRKIREWSTRLSVIKGQIEEVEAEAARAFYKMAEQPREDPS